ncbi:MAG TPA: EVE domain-containing protein [Novosphingobium sp.]|jgi:predicted RNA-binding protein with PUA-like domain|nr:EVE domain-containing protein [Novosphingobium sp.]
MTKPENSVPSGRLWLMKSEPDAYSWDDLVAEGEGTWDGVRNHRAANNMRAMEVGDQAFFYHSNIGKEIVGIIEISQSGLTDPTDPEGKWACVKVKPVRKLASPVTLAEIKARPDLQDMELIRLGRLSVAELKPEEWAKVLEMAGE